MTDTTGSHTSSIRMAYPHFPFPLYGEIIPHTLIRLLPQIPLLTTDIHRSQAQYKNQSQEPNTHPLQSKRNTTVLQGVTNLAEFLDAGAISPKRRFQFPIKGQTLPHNIITMPAVIPVFIT